MDFRTRFKRCLAVARTQWVAFTDTPGGRRTLKVLRYVLTAAIVAYLVYQLSHIGWSNVWSALPSTPWFYIIFLGMYLTLPAAQALIFGILWKLPISQVLPATVKKRIYDKDVMSYSGDIFMYFWGQRHTELPGRTLLHHLKDNAIISSVTSTLVAIGVLATLFAGGLLSLPDLLEKQQLVYAALSLAIAVGAVVLGVRFRQTVFALEGQILALLVGLHLARILAVQGLQITQWVVVLPAVPLQAWFTYLAVQIIVGRIPFLPSRDLIFMSIGIGLAGAMNVPEAAIAGLLGVHSVLDKSFNVLLFGIFSYTERSRQPPEALPDAPDTIPEGYLSDSDSAPSQAPVEKKKNA